MDIIKQGIGNNCSCFNLWYVYSSDEDTDLNALLKSWLRNQPEEYRQNLENWMGDYFEKALNWVLKQVSNLRFQCNFKVCIILFYLVRLKKNCHKLPVPLVIKTQSD